MKQASYEARGLKKYGLITVLLVQLLAREFASDLEYRTHPQVLWLHCND